MKLEDGYEKIRIARTGPNQDKVNRFLKWVEAQGYIVWDLSGDTRYEIDGIQALCAGQMDASTSLNMDNSTVSLAINGSKQKNERVNMRRHTLTLAYTVDARMRRNAIHGSVPPINLIGHGSQSAQASKFPTLSRLA